jgi:3-phosphoshikimate 1-carboxyvinyltransferase
MISIFHPNGKLEGEVELPASKSISNRLLILQAQYSDIEIENLSEAEDTVLLQKALKQKSSTIDVNHAGSSLRFLTAYFAFTPGNKVILTGSKRLQQRPIKPLVDSLKSLGANIIYQENEGFAPLVIEGIKAPNSGEVTIDASKSSQFVTALLLIAGNFKDGFKVKLQNEIVSESYIDLTLKLLSKFGFETKIEENEISAKFQSLKTKNFFVENDWSAASFFMSMACLSSDCNLLLNGLKESDLQGDKSQVALFEQLGLTPSFEEKGLRLKSNTGSLKTFDCNLLEMPDVTQALVVTLAQKNIEANISGLQTLPSKETDRIEALKTELQKFGKTINTGKDFINVSGEFIQNPNTTIETYHDHRMAMAFAAIGLNQKINIVDEEVVSKSFPNYWEVLKSLGFVIDITS